MTTPHARNSETSRLAAVAIAQDTCRLRVLVKKIIRWSEVGLTCDELEEIAEMRHQTASARINELRNRGDIQPLLDAEGKPVRRKTRSGRLATVYVATPPSALGNAGR